MTACEGSSEVAAPPVMTTDVSAATTLVPVREFEPESTPLLEDEWDPVPGRSKEHESSVSQFRLGKSAHSALRLPASLLMLKVADPLFRASGQCLTVY